MWQFSTNERRNGDELEWKVKVVLILWGVLVGVVRGPSALVAAACWNLLEEFFQKLGTKMGDEQVMDISFFRSKFVLAQYIVWKVDQFVRRFCSRNRSYRRGRIWWYRLWILFSFWKSRFDIFQYIIWKVAVWSRRVREGGRGITVGLFWMVTNFLKKFY